MSNRFLQDAGATPPAPADVVKFDLSGLGDGIWKALMDHLGEIGAAAWQGI